MLISKFDLYKSEWLDLVFDSRNKDYGAYDLRQHYAGNMVRAMGITFLGVSLLFSAGIIFRSNTPVVKVTPVDVTPPIIAVPPPSKPIKKPVPPAPLKPLPPAPPTATTRFVPPVVQPDNTIIEEPPKNATISGAVGQTTSTAGAIVDNPPADAPPGGGTTAAPDNSVHNMIGLESMPEPVGGEKAWSKFLNKNLRFPAAAQEVGASGRVILGFIIEKDGSLSNITVDRPAGNGFDEEALRVLKLAKAWKPGIQNGQPVRVKFEIPINFQYSGDSN